MMSGKLAVPVLAGMEESRTETLTLKVPAVVGVPVIAPDVWLSCNPCGRLVAPHDSGAVPVGAVRFAEYALLTVPPGRVVGLIAMPEPPPPPTPLMVRL